MEITGAGENKQCDQVYLNMHQAQLLTLTQDRNCCHVSNLSVLIDLSSACVSMVGRSLLCAHDTMEILSVHKTI